MIAQRYFDHGNNCTSYGQEYKNTPVFKKNRAMGEIENLKKE